MMTEASRRPLFQDLSGLLLTGLVVGGLVGVLPAEAQGYTASQTSGAFRSIASTGTPLSFASTDDDTSPLSIPFSFTFFGTPVSAGYASTNGLITFGTSSNAYASVAVPSTGAPNNFIAPLWADLELGTGRVLTAEGTNSLGLRAFIVEWSNVRPLSTSIAFSMQARLGTDGSIELAYSYSSAPSVNGVIGVENASGTQGAAAPCGPTCSLSGVGTGTIFRFEPGAPMSGPDLAFSPTPTPPPRLVMGQSVSMPFTIVNQGASSLSSSVEVMVIFDEFGDGPDQGDPPVGLTSVSAPAAGFGTRSGTLNLQAPTGIAAGFYDLYAVVDGNLQSGDVNPGNNGVALGPVELAGSSGGDILISTSSLPEATVGQSYSGRLNASPSGCTWSIVSGTLPAGLRLDGASGTISGVPSVATTASFTVQASRSGLTPATAGLFIIVNSGGGGGLRVTTESLPQGTVGAPFSATLSASGGSPPYAFQVVNGAPEWLRLDPSTGNLSGTPQSAARYTIGFAVFDQAAMSAEVSLTLEVTESVDLAWETEAGALQAGVVGRPYEFALSVRGGAQPYVYSLASGALPAGLQLGESGLIGGTPSMSSSATFEVSVRDGRGGTVQRGFTIAVTELRPLAVDVAATISLRVRAEAAFELKAQGGVAPYSWRVESGALPTGVRLEDGFLRGTPTSTRAGSLVTLAVRDSDGMEASKEVRIDITSATGGGGGSSGGGGGARGGGRRDSGGCTCLGAGRSSGGSTGTGLGSLSVVVALGALALARPVRRRPGAFPSSSNRGLTGPDEHDRGTR